MIGIEVKGNFNKTDKFLQYIKQGKYKRLDAAPRRGVEALASATPVDSGVTANSWTYEIKETNGGFAIHWMNTNTNDGIPIVVLIQYGHGTGTGGYVQGRDFINPAMRPIFDDIAADMWKEVTSA